MALDASKIFAISADVFVAPQGTSTGTPASWTDVGWTRKGSAKLTEAGRTEVDLHDNSKHLLSILFKFEVEGLETDSAKITALEAFLTQKVDILLVNRADRTSGFLLTDFTFVMAPNFEFNLDNPKSLKLEATRAAKKISDVYAEQTGLSGF